MAEHKFEYDISKDANTVKQINLIVGHGKNAEVKLNKSKGTLEVVETHRFFKEAFGEEFDEYATKELIELVESGESVEVRKENRDGKQCYVFIINSRTLRMSSLI